jgi:hypothetical protein
VVIASSATPDYLLSFHRARAPRPYCSSSIPKYSSIISWLPREAISIAMASRFSFCSSSFMTLDEKARICPGVYPLMSLKLCPPPTRVWIASARVKSPSLSVP